MARFLWLTDIHLNFLEPALVEAFLDALTARPADGVFLSGDIGEAPDVTRYLGAIEARLQCPLYFVLGNHDFYYGSMAEVRQDIEQLCAAHRRLCWLPRAGVVSLSERSALIGHDGWGDGRLGDYLQSPVKLNDWRLIDELAGLGSAERLDVLQALGDEAAAHFQAVLPEALQRFQHVYVLIHVPPFREACLYEGRIAGDDWLPHFTCHAAGQVLQHAMAAHPDRQMTVLCGHTHAAADVQILPNLRALTGGAGYGQPGIQRAFEVD
jgi:predicted phosphodiesterase